MSIPPAGPPTIKSNAPVVLQDDDEFEDFPPTIFEKEEAKPWAVTWEDEDTTVAFAVQLAKERLAKDAMVVG